MKNLKDNHGEKSNLTYVAKKNKRRGKGEGYSFREKKRKNETYGIKVPETKHSARGRLFESTLFETEACEKLRRPRRELPSFGGI